MNLFPELTFNEDTHQYFVSDIPLDFSVSYWLHYFSNEFDEDNISKAIAKRDNVSQESIIQKWKDTAKQATDLGTKVHKFAEDYALNKSLIPENHYEENVIKFYNDLPSNLSIYGTEIQMYHKQYLFGGTTDLVLKNNDVNELYILDWKTNKDLFKNYNNQRLKGSFKFLLDNPINKYQLQLNIYQLMLQQVVDIPITKRIIVWLTPDNYEMYNCQDYTSLLTNFFNYYYEQI